MKSTQLEILLAGLGIVLTALVPQVNAEFTLGESKELDSASWDYIPPTTTNNGLLKFCDSRRTGGVGGYDIWVASRDTINADWGVSVNLGPHINSTHDEFAPRISANGLSLYFESDRPGGYGHTDIYMSTRTTIDDDWGKAVNLGTLVNSSAHECSPSVTADGLELFFAGWKSPFRSGGYGDADIWVTNRATTNDPWGEPVNLGPVVNSSSQDARCYVSPNGLMLLFDSKRPGGYGWADLYMTRRDTRSDPWQTPVNLGPAVNSSDFEECATISFDGSILFFDRHFAGNIYQAPILPIVDFTGDCQVDIKDLTILIEHWGQNEPACDMGPMPWGDGVIDEADLEVLMSYWGQELYDPHFLAHWKLDETEGDVAYDSAGENDAVVMGDATWQPAGGQVDGALEFDGIDDYIETPRILNPADGPFSVFAWVKGSEAGQVILSQENGVNWLQVDVDGTLMTELRSSGHRRPSSLYSETVITDGNWHRIGFVWDGSQRILYVDDIPVALDSQGSLDSATDGLIIGASTENQDGTLWSGLIDDVRIYDRVVTP